MTAYSHPMDSRVPWLGPIPSGWRIERGKWLFRKMDRPVHESDDVITCFRDGAVTLRRNRRVRGFTESLQEIGYQGIKRGDLVIHEMDAFAGAVGVSDSDGKGTGVYSVCQPRPSADPRYFAYVVREMARNGWILALSTGIRERSTDFRFDTFAAQPLPLPPLGEQEMIANLLDHADRRIRRAIRAKQKLIALLNEQKQAMIARLVTQGSDMRPFTRCVVERADYRGATPEKTDTGVFLVTARNIRRGWIDYETSAEFVSEADYSRIMRRGLPKLGDVLLTTEAPLGNAALVDREDVALAQRVIRFRMDPRLFEPEFVLHSVLSPYFQHQLDCRGTGSTAVGIKASKLPQLRILCPPLVEQRAIIEAIREQSRSLDQALKRAENEVVLLREYHTRLIADAVTGKLDVRIAEPEPVEA